MIEGNGIKRGKKVERIKKILEEMEGFIKEEERKIDKEKRKVIIDEKMKGMDGMWEEEMK